MTTLKGTIDVELEETPEGGYTVRAYGILNPAQDTIRPSQVVNVVEDIISATRVDFTWDPSTDDTAVAGYQPFIDGSPTSATTAVPSYSFTGLTPGQTYEITFTAFDTEGNHGAPSDPITVEMPSLAGPAWNAVAQQELTTSVAYFLDLNDECSDIDSVGLTFAQISGSVTGVSLNGQGQFTGTPTAVQTSSVVFRASDGFNTADITIVFRVLNADTTGPNAPANIAGQILTPTLVRVTADTTTDATVANARTSGVASYQLLRDGAPRVSGLASPSTDDVTVAGTSYSYQYRAIDVAGNPGTLSSALPITMPPATGQTTIRVKKNGTGDFTTIAAALAVAQPNDIVGIQDNGVYNEAIVSVRQGTSHTARITLRADSGFSPEVTGKATRNNVEARMHLEHTFLDFGEGILFQGNCDGTTANFSGADPDWGCSVRADDNIVRGIYRNFKLGHCTTGPGADRTRYAVDADLCGTLQKTNGQDAGEGLQIEGTAGNTVIDGSRIARGGHNCVRISHPNKVLVRYTLMTSDWQSVWGAGAGNRLFETLGSNARTVFEYSVFHTSLDAPENPGALNLCKDQNGNTLWRKSFLLNHQGGDGMLAMQCTANAGSQGARDQRKANLTFHNSNGTALKMRDELGSSPAFGPFYFYNCLFSAISGPRVLILQWRSSRGVDWTELLFLKACAFASDYNVRIQDLTTGTILDGTVSDFMASHSDNFASDIQIVAPDYASTSLPASNDPYVALAEAQANFLPGEASLLGAGVHLTQVNQSGGVVNSPIVPVDDAKWFSDGMGFHGVPGDTIFIVGGGTRVIQAISGNVITLTQPVNAANNAQIYLGTSASPNIGAA